jgi:hypothetical protein
VVIVPIIGDKDIVFETDLGGGYIYKEGYIDRIVHNYVKDSNVNEYAMILVVFGDNIQTANTQSNEVQDILGMMVGSDSYFVPGTVNGGDLLHEWGHKFGKLCNEGYYIFPISKSSCESGYATGMFKGYGGCDETPEYDCCPNVPETDPNGRGSIMCSADVCGTGCVQGYFFTESASKAVRKALEEEWYC